MSRKNKNGTVTSYVQLAHNERNPVTGNPQAKVYYTFGREDEVDMGGLRRLAKNISRFVGDAPVSKDEPQENVQLRLLDSKEFGTGYVLQSLWQELGIDKALSNRLRDRKYEAPHGTRAVCHGGESSTESIQQACHGRLGQRRSCITWCRAL